MQLLYVGGHLAADATLQADALGGGVVCSCYKGRVGSTLIEVGQVVENGSVAVVQQKDAQVQGRQERVPQRILVVEEAEVAYDAEDSWVLSVEC